jgi:FkbM family methyltransferase
MSKFKQLFAKGKRFVYVSLMLKLKGSDKFRFENLPHPIHLRRGTSDIPTFHQIFTFRDYDIPLPFEPRTIIDAGANIGFASVYFANKFPGANIVCVEPEKSNFEILQKNIQGYANITPLKNAISNEGGTTFNVVDGGGGNWGFMTLSESATTKGKIVDTVATISIGEIVAQMGFDRIDLLKIDIEGAEKELFENNYETWLPKTRCLIIELHDGMKPGCSKSFFSAISKYDFSYRHRGENLIFTNNA